MTTQVASLEAIFTANTTDLMSGLRKADNAISGFGDKVGRVGSSLTGLGTTLGAAVTPAVGAFTAAAFAAMSFDEAMTNANSILQLSEEEIAAVSSEILAMGTNALAGPQAVAEAYYDIVSGVQDVSTHMAILDTSIAVSEANAAGLQGVTSALVSVMNSYGLSAEDAAYAGDVFTRIIGMGVVTGDELAASLAAVTPMASEMGISLDDLGAYVAYFTTQGVSASEATTQLSGMMNALLKPTEAMSAGLEEIGFSTGQAAVDALGLAGTYQALEAALGTEQLSEATGRVEAFRGALMITNDGANQFFDTFSGGSIALHNAMINVSQMKGAIESSMALGQSDLWGNKANLASVNALAEEMQYLADGTDSYNEAARKVQRASPAAQFKLMKAQVAGLAIEVGTALLPAMVELFTAIKPVITNVVEWVKENPKLVSTIAVITFGLAALAAVLIPLGLLISAVGSVFGVLGAIIGAVSLPVLLLVGALGLLALAYRENFLGIQDALKPAIEWLGTAILDVIGWFGGLINAFQEGGLAGVAVLIASQIAELASTIAGADWGMVWESIKAMGALLWDKFKEGALMGVDWVLSNIVTPLVVAISSTDWGMVWAQMIAMAGKLWENFKTGLLLAVDFVLINIVTPIANSILSTDWSMVWTNIQARGVELWENMKTGLLLAADFVMVNIVAPLAGQITGTDWGSVISNVTAKAGEIATAFKDELVGSVAGIWDAFKQALNDLIPNSINFGTTIDAGVFGSENVSASLNLPDNPFKAGTPWTGGMGRNVAAGIVHGQEAVIPTGGMVARVVPSPDGLQVHTRGGGGGGINIGVVNVYGVENPAQFYDEIQKEAQRRSATVGVW